jgi:hypothetical protein
MDDYVILSVKVESDDEWELVQNLMFCLGYDWFSGNKTIYPRFKNRNFLDIWSHGLITHSAYGDKINLTLNGFLNQIDEYDLKFEKK